MGLLDWCELFFPDEEEEVRVLVQALRNARNAREAGGSTRSRQLAQFAPATLCRIRDESGSGPLAPPKFASFKVSTVAAASRGGTSSASSTTSSSPSSALPPPTRPIEATEAAEAAAAATPTVEARLASMEREIGKLVELLGPRLSMEESYGELADADSEEAEAEAGPMQSVELLTCSRTSSIQEGLPDNRADI